ncbi:class A beta-lactamase [Allosalinactinospora lopnorensis]|uniref:class A beta-lactamase n=1 Tax=Allosalinactinospora lopnorensis TaxID=1352348 RepID=UPI000623C7A5|nr:class A beta-lactamase [Allosalinactinospora lopnorensis]
MLYRPARRAAFAALAAIAVSPLAGCAAAPDASPSDDSAAQSSEAPYAAEFERLEEEFDARLGVYALDTGTGLDVAHRSDERFAYASTFKPLACGAVMERRSIAELEEVVGYGAEDLVEYSPITEEHVDTGMTLLEACDAAIRYSDNTAANLLFDELGGPQGLQDALVEIGDDTTQADRRETGLNEAAPGDTRDTSTPEALAADLREYVLGDPLPEEKRTLLREMLLENTTGGDLIRAGIPDGWEVGDKTGSAGYGTRNDIAVLWPPDGDPIVLAVLSSRDGEDAESEDALIAEAAAVAADALR